MQIRKMVSLDCLFDAILAHAVPFRMKTSYLRLLFNGYIQSVESISSIFIHKDDSFLDMVKEVVLYDIEHYYEYYKGLIMRNIEDKNDPN